MLNVLKYDLFKLKKSKNLRLFYVFTLVLMLAFNVITFFSKTKDYSVLFNFACSDFAIIYCLGIFFCGVFVGDDFSSRYIINIYPDMNKVEYVLSKIIYTVAYCLIIYLLNILIIICLVYIFGARCFLAENDNYIAENFVKKSVICLILKFFGVVSACSVTIFLCLLIKNNYIVMGAEFGYAFLISGSLVGELDKAAKINFEYYLPFSSKLITPITLPDIFYPSFLALLFLTAIFTIFSCVVLAKKKI